MALQGDITVITDIGVDDALALVLLDKLAGNRRKNLISTFGNTNEANTGKNAREFAAYMQHEWYFHQGARLPLDNKYAPFSAEDYHGADGLWGVRPPRSSLSPKMIDTISGNEVISLGPLTQAYMMLKNNQLKRVTLMGGYFKDETHAAIRPQANVRMDIDAAETFFHSCHGVTVRVVPHNVTRHVFWTREMVETVPNTSRINIWLKTLMLTWFENCPYERFALHDPVATLLALKPGNAHWIKSGVKVLRGGNSEGMTELSLNNPPCDVAIAIDNPEMVAERIFSLVFDL